MELQHLQWHFVIPPTWPQSRLHRLTKVYKTYKSHSWNWSLDSLISVGWVKHPCHNLRLCSHLWLTAGGPVCYCTPIQVQIQSEFLPEITPESDQKFPNANGSHTGAVLTGSIERQSHSPVMQIGCRALYVHPTRIYVNPALQPPWEPWQSDHSICHHLVIVQYILIQLLLESRRHHFNVIYSLLYRRTLEFKGKLIVLGKHYLKCLVCVLYIADFL